MHITVNVILFSVTVGHVQHAAPPGHVVQYGGLKNVTTEYRSRLYL
jgi:hypothetical protein